MMKLKAITKKIDCLRQISDLIRKNNRRGMTIIELLISVAIGVIVTTAAMSLYITEHKQFLVQGSISDMQSSLRAASQELASKIRLAGYNVADPTMAIRASNTNPDTITIGYDPGITCGSIAVNNQMPQTSAELRVSGDLSCIEEGDTLYIYDPTTRYGENFICTNVQASAGHLQHNTTSLHESYPVGSRILRQNFFKYYIDATNAAHPNLMIQTGIGAPQIYAENISNLNLSYVMSSGAVVDVPSVVSMVREVIIRVNARSDQTDSDLQNQYRTRSLTTRVKVRNLGIS
jgi:prepilin-type N-terminal cleavage/methylation domain-containing protein